jgi:hypothetical protein
MEQVDIEEMKELNYGVGTAISLSCPCVPVPETWCTIHLEIWQYKKHWLKA